MGQSGLPYQGKSDKRREQKIENQVKLQYKGKNVKTWRLTAYNRIGQNRIELNMNDVNLKCV